MMKIIAVIPARYKASRFPGKLMQMLGDKTVIATTYHNVLNTKLFDDVLVVTDAQVIHDEITQQGGQAIYSIKEHETGSDRIAEAVENIDCDIVINVQGDEPFLKKEPLEQLIEVFKQDIEQQISLASLKIRLHHMADIENPNHVKVICDLQNLALYFSRSVIPFPRDTETEIAYYKHVGVYAFRKEALMKFSQLPMTALEKAEKIECIRYLEHGMRLKMIETYFQGVGIDTPEDLEKARQLLKDIDNPKY